MDAQNVHLGRLVDGEFLRATEAAELVRLSPDHLARLRMAGGGPAFVKIGRGRQGAVRYPKSALEAWLQARLLRSTSQQIDEVLQRTGKGNLP